MNTLSLFNRSPRLVGNGHAHIDSSSSLYAFHRELDHFLDVSGHAAEEARAPTTKNRDPVSEPG
jgi:hypothetical protein